MKQTFSKVEALVVMVTLFQAPLHVCLHLLHQGLKVEHTPVLLNGSKSKILICTFPFTTRLEKKKKNKRKKKTISTFSLATRPKTEDKTDNLYYMLIFATKLSQYLRFRLKLVKVEVKHRFTLQVLIHLHTLLSD